MEGNSRNGSKRKLLLIASATVAAGIAVAGDAKAPAAGSAQWGMYNKSYDGQRYSTLTQINTKNVAKLKPVCVAELGDAGAFQPGPLVIGDTIYLTTATSTVALDATSCDIQWQNIYNRDQMAARVARDIPEGAYVNLGIGLPTLVANHLPKDRKIFLHSENGMLAMGPAPALGEEDWDVINAGKHPSPCLPAVPIFTTPILSP